MIGALSGVRLQAGVVGETVVSNRGATLQTQVDGIFGGEIGAAPLFDGVDYVRLHTAVAAGTLGARGSDGNAAVRVSSTDVRWWTQAFGYYPVHFLPWLSLRPGLLLGLDLSFRPTTTEVLGTRTSHTAIVPGVCYGGRVELDLWHFFVAVTGWGTTSVAAGVARTAGFLGGTMGAHFDLGVPNQSDR